MVRTRSKEPRTIGDACPSQDFVPTCRSNTNSEDRTGRTLPIIKAFSVQCAACLKWRFIPSKEMYENIRQVVSENPFVCEHASSWRLHASCNDPSDFSHDTNLLWVLDNPDIPVTPTGWERFLVFRAQGSVFADVYYRSPTGKRLRSMPEVERYTTLRCLLRYCLSVSENVGRFFNLFLQIFRGASGACKRHQH